MPTWDGTQWVPDSPPAGSPSAISGLLALLTANPPSPQQTPGQGPPPNGALPPQGGPSGPPMPVGNMQTPPMPQTPSLNVPNPQTIQSLMQTGQAGLPPSQQHQSFLGSLHDKIQNFLTGSAPSGYDNLLTPEQQKKDQPGIVESLLGGGIFAPLLGRAMYERNLGRNVDMNQLAGQIQATNAQRMEQARQLYYTQQIPQLFQQPGPNASTGDMRHYLQQVYGFAVSHNLPEIMKDTGARLNTIYAMPKFTNTPPGDVTLDENGKPVFYNPKTETWTQRNVMLDGKPSVVQVNPQGQYRDQSGTPINLQQHTLAPYAPPVQPQLVAGGLGPDGKPQYLSWTKGAPDLTPVGGGTPRVPGTGSLGSLPAPMAAKVGQFGEMLKKTSDLFPAMDALAVSLSSSAGQDIAMHGIAGIPGTRGIGSEMVNRTPQYARYEAALSPFILAAAHALSGARINQDQVEQIKQSIEIRPGDTPTVLEQKRKNLMDLLNSIGGSLPAAAVATQEAQMKPEEIASLKALGYEAGTRSGGSGGNNAGGGGGASTKQQMYDAAANYMRAQKATPAAILAKLGPRPGNE